jgi:chromosome segregation ATPase
MGDPEELFQELQRLQDENFALSGRISEFRRARASSQAGEVPAEDVQARIEQTKQEIDRAEQEKIELKRDLARLIETEEQLQAQIREGDAEVTGTLLPRLTAELQQTDEFYSSLLAELGAASPEKLDVLRALISEVREKRNATMVDRREYQNINRLIQYELTRVGVAAKGDPGATRRGQSTLV